MNRKTLLFLLFLIFPFLLLQSQEKQDIDVLHHIDEVQVTGSAKKEFSAGTHIQKMDSIVKVTMDHGSLADVLSAHAPVYIKKDAGGMSTLQIRGTSADHTAIMFGCLNLNSLTLGHSNLSNLSVFLFDDIKIHYGSNSSLYGSDAIGGSLHLNTRSTWEKDLKASLRQDIGSFGSYFSGAKIKAGNKKWSHATRVYHRQKKNNFSFVNKAAYDFEKDRYIKDVQQNASFRNYGLLEEVHYKIQKDERISLKAWFDNNWHEIQPNMSANYYGGSFDEILNRHYRIYSQYHKKTSRGKIDGYAGFVRDYQVFDQNKDEIIATNRGIAQAEFSHQFKWNGKLLTGAKYTHIVPQVHAYEKDISEQRSEVFTSYRQKLDPGIELTASLRSLLVSSYRSPVSPSVGMEMPVWHNHNQSVKIRASWARSYKIPTFNDRFWYPNGNPDLKPEDGTTLEGGLRYALYGQNTRLKINGTIYHMNVSNWIQWVNLDMWRPVNNQEVQNKGAELQLSSTTELGFAKMQGKINYAYNQTIKEKGSGPDSPSIGKQLIYTPRHVANAFIALSRNNWSLSMNLSYTGKRMIGYTREESMSLDPYTLFHMNASRKFSMKQHIFDIKASVNNLLDIQYQNVKNYAMPGRSYKLGISYYFK